ncbi:MAG: hypothetical protein WBN10_20105 [Polyangiales bacterium]
MVLVRSKRDRSLYGIVFSIAAVLTGLSAAWSTIAMPITPYDTLVYLLLPSLAAVMTIRWARRTPEWSWPVLITHQIVLSVLCFALYLGLWILLFMAAWGGGYLLIGLFGLPLLVLVACYRRARDWAGVASTNARRAIRTGLGTAGLTYAAYAAYQLRAIFRFRSTSETALVARLSDFLLIAPIIVLGSFAVAWSVATLVHTVRETASAESEAQPGLGARARAAMALGVVLSVMIGIALTAGYHEVLLNEANAAQAGEDLATLHARPWVRHDKAVLRAIAQNPNAPKILLDKLSTHEDVSVRMQVARNPQTRRGVLRRMHYTRELDSALALNLNTPPEILDDIARTGDDTARWNVASNPTTADDTLKSLLHDKQDQIRKHASVRLQFRDRQTGGATQDE